MKIVGFAVVCLFAAMAFAAPASAPAVRKAVPEAGVLKASQKMVADLYKDEIAGAKTGDQKVALAKSMLVVAAEEKQAASQYALFMIAADLITSTGDLEAATGVVGQVERHFEIDGLKARCDVVVNAAKVTRTAEQARKLVSLAGGMIDSAVFADRYESAKILADAAVAAGRNASDGVALKEALAKSADVREAEAACLALKSAAITLASKPNDPEANQSVGKYRCFFKNDWSSGLPLLAKAADEVLKNLAKNEIASAKGADDLVKLADAWWDYSEKSMGLAQRNIKDHAGTLYSAALPNLAGLLKMRVQKRLESLDPDAGAQAGKKTIDLVALLVDPAKGTVAGTWQVKDKVLKSDDSSCRLEFPYHPPAEYDFHVEFTRESGDDSVNLVCVGGGRHFMWTLGGWKNTVLWFDEISKVRAQAHPKAIVAKSVLENGKRYDTVVKVRKTGIEAYVNGKLVAQWKTDFSDMGIPRNWNINDPAAVGLATNHGATTFYKVEVVEVSGQGTVVKK